jgi:hypothetical protein
MKLPARAASLPPKVARPPEAAGEPALGVQSSDAVVGSEGRLANRLAAEAPDSSMLLDANLLRWP